MLHRLSLHHGMPVHQDVRMRLYEGSRQVFCRVDGHHIHITNSLDTHLSPIKLDPGRKAGKGLCKRQHSAKPNDDSVQTAMTSGQDSQLDAAAPAAVVCIQSDTQAS